MFSRILATDNEGASPILVVLLVSLLVLAALSAKLLVVHRRQATVKRLLTQYESVARDAARLKVIAEITALNKQTAAVAGRWRDCTAITTPLLQDIARNTPAAAQIRGLELQCLPEKEFTTTLEKWNAVLHLHGLIVDHHPDRALIDWLHDMQQRPGITRLFKQITLDRFGREEEYASVAGDSPALRIRTFSISSQHAVKP